MITFPKAKINIGLRVTSKRSDGFHNIETLFYPVGLTDALEFVQDDTGNKGDVITVTGIDISSKPDDNLVIKALSKIRENHKLPFFRIHLHKAIPSGAGLGGGSSDAAFIMRAVNKCFNLGIDEATLKSYALEVGSDSPFFINPVPSFATGRGEVLTPAPGYLEGFYIILLNPGVTISTRDAYNNCKPSLPEDSLEELMKEGIQNWKRKIKNDFEDYAFQIFPLIREIKRSLYDSGALYSSMSGSGSTVYGIFSERHDIGAGLRKYLIYEGKL
jgi:4-diphosphocytidyl-2-C-methyl-D-erythritol kinase